MLLAFSLVVFVKIFSKVSTCGFCDFVCFLNKYLNDSIVGFFGFK